MPTHSLLTSIALALGCSALLAQCPTPPGVAPLGSWASPAGTVSAMTKWDPDGPGPLGMHVVCGGDFLYAGAAATAHVALFDPVSRTFSAIGVGFDAPVRALAVLANGSLVAGGEFTNSGTTPVARVARWNGTAWVGLGAGTDDTVSALLALPNGDLVAGGAFTTAGGLVTNHVARWNGLAWAGLGGGVAGTIPGPIPPPPLFTTVTHLGARLNGDLVIAGEFSTAGGTAANGIAIWNGIGWSSPLPGPTTLHVAAMRVLANGDVLASFGDLASTWFVSRWNGAIWTPLGGPSQVPYTALGELANGTLLATGYDLFSSMGQLEQWSGAAWFRVGVEFVCGTGTALLEVTPGDLWMATRDDRGALANAWRWNGITWTPPAAGLDQRIETVVAYEDGFAIAGRFTQVGTIAAANLARLTVSGAMSIGVVDGYVAAMTVAANGDLVIGGILNSVGGTPTTGVARFDGTLWHAVGTSLWFVQALAAMPNGELVAAGFDISNTPRVERWNGSTWTVLGSLGALAQDMSSLAVLPNGDVVLGLTYTPGTKVLRWDGSNWAALGSGLASGSFYDSVDALCVLPNGDLVAGGRFTSGAVTNVARWDGQAWQPMGAGLPSQVTDLDLLPGGGLLATHSHFDDVGQPVLSPSRWDGATWTPIVGIGATGYGTARCSAVHGDGFAVVTGSFQTVQGVSAGGVALLTAGCPATSFPTGAGCVGSAGPVQLSVLSHAWLGGTYRARTVGLPFPAIAVQVFGLTSVSLPLANVLPSFPGCTLHVSPDVLLADLPTAGAVTAQWALPNSASLLGQSFRQQTVPFELAASGAIATVSASNAVLLTIGAW